MYDLIPALMISTGNSAISSVTINEFLLTLKGSWPLLIILIGALLATIGGVLINFERWPKLKKLSTYIVISGAIMSFIGGWVLNLEQDAISKELRDKSNKIVQLNEEIKGSITGGDSFCCVLPYMDWLNNVQFTLLHIGKYPMYDVTISVTDTTILNTFDWGALYERYYGYRRKILTPEEEKEFSSDEQIKKRASIDRSMMKEWRETQKKGILIDSKYLGTVTSNINFQSKHVLGFILKPDNETHKFVVYINARNGSFRQSIEFKPDINHWKMESHVVKLLSDRKQLPLKGFIGGFYNKIFGVTNLDK
jgi:hypothetical protein